MKYDFIEINNFIVVNGSAEHYEADLRLYKKLFPESPILKELENIFPPKKGEFDERMLFEILNADRVCFETILENRGIVSDNAVLDLDPATEMLIKTLDERDVESLTYNEAKTLVYGLKLQVADQKGVSLKAALAAFKALPKAEPIIVTKTDETAQTDDTTQSDTTAQTDDAAHTDDAPIIEAPTVSEVADSESAQSPEEKKS